MASRYLQEEANVDVYLANQMSGIKYPYRVQQIKYSRTTTFDQSDKHILDSSIGKNYSNGDVVEEAERLGAEIVVPCDEIGDHEATLAQVGDMFEQIEDTDMRMVVPIQEDDNNPRYESSVDTVEFVEDHGYEDSVEMYAVGGVKDCSVPEQIDAARVTRRALPDKHIHLFGVGYSGEVVKHVREGEEAFDSMDNASAMQYARTGDYMSAKFERLDIGIPKGTNSTYAQARMVESMLTNLNHLLSDGPNTEDVDKLLERF